MRLLIGTEEHGATWALPSDMVARTHAVIGQRGAGKSTLATVIGEELCKLGLPWMALDPVGVWWGLRAKADGTPGGFPVVVFGGERGDLPLEKGHGRKIAEACVAANVCAVIDLSRDSKTTWRTIVRDFCHALQELRPEAPRHIFLEEGPEFVPQRASHQLGAECKEIVERLIRLGRNWGYGATVLSQRPATIDKDVLSQCENLFVMRTSGAHDRKALREWMEAHGTEKSIDKVLASLATLKDGEAWLWSPQWLETLVRLQIRKRETFHPGATRTVGGKATSVELAPVDEFVAKVRKQLTKTTVSVCKPVKNTKTAKALASCPDVIGNPDLEDLVARCDRLEAQTKFLNGALGEARTRAAEAERRLEAVRKHLRPQYDALASLFEDLGESAAAPNGADRSVYEPWLVKARKRGCGRMLEILLERRELTRIQLGTLSGVAPGKSTFRAYMYWLKSNGLVQVEGEMVRLQAV